ncbi:MAG: Gfo/Idh/MocA family oxidoreductase [Elusimicrobia bacterium]|nr:Gfo/Idh/MocA family oxidoreductase [Elusimicrobiota bacterium]
MTAVEDLLVGVLGTGNIGSRHLRVLGNLDGIKPVAIPARSGRLRQLEDTGLKVAKNWQEASRMGSHLGIVATDTGRHHQDALEAFGAGFDLLIEKPMATDHDQAAKILQASKKSRRKAYVACVLRFSESLNQFRRWLPRAGRLHSVMIACRSYVPDWRPERDYRQMYLAKASEGGVLRDLIHEIDYAGWLYGWPGRVEARLKNFGRLGIEAEEMAWLRWEASCGALVCVHLDYLTRPPTRGMVAHGEGGTLEWDGLLQRVRWRGCQSNDNDDMQSHQERDVMFRDQFLAFLEACRGSVDERLATDHDGARALALCDAARRSSESGRSEEVVYV